ncbi:MAG: peptidoglycan-binding protein LysM [Bacteroidia bacterium]
MGVFDFAKNAGAAAASGDLHETMINNLFDTKLKEYGLVVKNSHVEYHDGVITITGEAADQATKEKVVLAMGNLNGVSKVDDRMTVYKKPEAVKPEPESKFYTVVKGDTLSKIAKHFYGDAMKYPVIFEANKPMLKNPDLIYPGQVLRIPEL